MGFYILPENTLVIQWIERWTPSKGIQFLIPAAPVFSTPQWADLGWLAGAYHAALSLPLLCWTGEENRVRNRMDHDKDRSLITIMGKTDSPWRKLIYCHISWPKTCSCIESHMRDSVDMCSTMVLPMGCRRATCSRKVFSTGCQGMSALAPGIPPVNTSPTLVHRAV